MEVNGKEFLRNVSLEQEKVELAKQQQKLEEQKRESLKKTPEYFESDTQSDNSVYVDISNQGTEQQPQEEDTNHLYDIKLDNHTDKSNKKRTIILGIVLIVIFIITIVIMRVVSNNNIEDSLETSNTSTKTINKDKILDKIDSIEEYQKIIKPSNEQLLNTNKKDIILPESTKDNSPVEIDTPTATQKRQKDLFELEDKVSETNIVPKSKEITKKIVPTPKVEKKYPIKKEIAETNFAKKSTSTQSGYYIQIGAFSKYPSKKLLNSIKQKGYSFVVHKVVVKGKTYNKVLIGSYNTKKAASKNLNNIKQQFKNPNAYIFRLKR